MCCALPLHSFVYFSSILICHLSRSSCCRRAYHENALSLLPHSTLSLLSSPLLSPCRGEGERALPADSSCVCFFTLPADILRLLLSSPSKTFAHICYYCCCCSFWCDHQVDPHESAVRSSSPIVVPPSFLPDSLGRHAAGQDSV